MNINAMIKRLSGKLYVITRITGKGSYSDTDGTYTGGTSTTFEVMGSKQPMTVEDLVSIPEGDRTRERFRFYSFSKLKILDNKRLAKGDRVAIDADLFEVESLEDWPNHSKAVIVRVNTDAN